MQEASFSEFRNHAKHYFDLVERGEKVRIYRNGKPIGDLVPCSSSHPPWKNSPKTRISLEGLLLSGEIIADRENCR